MVASRNRWRQLQGLQPLPTRTISSSPAPDEAPDSSDLDEEAARPTRTVAVEGEGGSAGSDSDSEESDAESLAPSQGGDALPEWDSLSPLSLSPVRLQPVQRAATHPDAFAAPGVSNGVAEAYLYYGYSSPFSFAEPFQTGEVGGAAFSRRCARAPADSLPGAHLLQGRFHARCPLCAIVCSSKKRCESIKNLNKHVKMVHEEVSARPLPRAWALWALTFARAPACPAHQIKDFECPLGCGYASGQKSQIQRHVNKKWCGGLSKA